MYNIKLVAICCDLNFDKIYALYGVNLFHLKYGCVRFRTFRRSVSVTCRPLLNPLHPGRDTGAGDYLGDYQATVLGAR